MPTEPNGPDPIELSPHELREIAGHAAGQASGVLALFEESVPGDPRPREAVEAALAFAAGGPRTAALRRAAWAAFRAAREAAPPAAAEAARAASHAAGAAFLHPVASAHQVRHVLGATAHAARARELTAATTRPTPEAPTPRADATDVPGSPTTADEVAGVDGGEGWAWVCRGVPSAVVAVLRRLPAAPAGGGRVGEIMRGLDAALRR
ncbi:putative immunity protein [Streptomyces sp. NPDC100445]|uniref:putative immunity protein n=1 Tax=Streptomyces sp. NPDC100445 TaxID=3366102 RepID=UPI0037FC2CC7